MNNLRGCFFKNSDLRDDRSPLTVSNIHTKHNRLKICKSDFVLFINSLKPAGYRKNGQALNHSVRIGQRWILPGDIKILRTNIFLAQRQHFIIYIIFYN